MHLQTTKNIFFMKYLFRIIFNKLLNNDYLNRKSASNLKKLGFDFLYNVEFLFSKNYKRQNLGRITAMIKKAVLNLIPFERAGRMDQCLT